MRIGCQSTILLVVALAVPPAQGDVIRFGAMGDGLTEPYANYTGSFNPATGLPFWGAAGDKNWVEQLQALRPADFTIYNAAKAYATSSDVVSQGQHTTLANLVQQGKIDYATLIVGAHDLDPVLNGLETPTQFVTTLIGNFATVLNTLKAAGQVIPILANIPDISVTPALQFLLPVDQLPAVTGLVQFANQQIAALAAAYHVPLLDLFGLSQLAYGSITLGGVDVQRSQLFAPNLFDPATPLHGLLANMFLEAARRSGGAGVSALRLSDQEILGLANISHAAGQTYFDVNPFVVFTAATAVPEPSAFILCIVALLVGVIHQGLRRRKALRGERDPA